MKLLQNIKNLFLPKKEKKIKIFIIDDNKVFSKTLTKSIENQHGNHCTITTFEVGEISMIDHVVPDVAIIDYELNSKYYDAANGIETARFLQNLNKKLKIILISGLDITDKIEENNDLVFYKKDSNLISNINAFLQKEIKNI